jgi:ER lumen protein retaining receptor
MDIFLFVLSYLIQLIASAILIYRVWSLRSVNGLSIDTQICLLSSVISRCIWTLNTRIIGSSAVLAGLALLELFLSLFACVSLILFFRKLRHTILHSVPLGVSAVVLIPVTLTFAYVVNPGRWFALSSQILVAFSMYVEAVALAPQLLIARRIGDVEALTSHYIGLLVISRIVRMIFWVFMFIDGQSFLCLFIADLLHTILSTDFLRLWFKKLRHGGRLVYSL